MKYDFSDCTLDPDCHELRRGGRAVAVEPRVFDLLLYLLEHRHRLINKSELIRVVWRGRYISDWALSTCLKGVRRAIGDSGKRQALIRTVPGRGYRFVGEVAVHASMAGGAERAEAEPHRLEKPTIAILPFEDISSGGAGKSFSDSMAQSLATELSRFVDFDVVARNAVLALDDRAAGPVSVARQLGARYVLDGSIHQADRRIRISAQLIDGASGRQIWAERYDQGLEDTFTALDTITANICSALGARVSDDGQARALGGHANGATAFDFTQEAWAHFQRHTRAGNLEARRLGRKAVALAPRTASPYRMLSWTYCNQAVQQWCANIEGSMQKGHALACQALSLEDNVPAAYITLGNSELVLGRHQQAVDYFQKAIRLNRNNADGYAMLGSALNFSGRPDDGMVAVQTAMRLNPHHHGWYDMHLGRGQFALGAFAQARRTLANVAKAKPEYPVVRVNLAATLAVMGRQDEARAEVAKLLELNAGYSLGNVAKSLPYKDHVIRDRFLNALRLAELPD